MTINKKKRKNIKKKSAASAVKSNSDNCRSRTTGGLAENELETLCLYFDLMISFIIISTQLLYWISSPCDDLHLHFTLDDIQYSV